MAPVLWPDTPMKRTMPCCFAWRITSSAPPGPTIRSTSAFEPMAWKCRMSSLSVPSACSVRSSWRLAPAAVRSSILLTSVIRLRYIGTRYLP